MFKGIDISHHQGKVDWAALKNEVDFVIIRAGYGNTAAQKDTRFEEFYAGAKKYGIPVGCYWFSYATSAAEAKREAQACLQCIKGKTFEYPVWYDVEHKHQSSVSICKVIIPAFIETIKEAVRGIRNVRTQMNVAPSRKAKVFVVSDNDEMLDIFRTGKLFFESLAYANESVCQKDKEGIADDAVSVVLPGCNIYIPFAELVDIKAEIERLNKEKGKLEGELKRSKAMLSNEKFLSKAPEAKIAEEKEKQAKYQQQYDQIVERLEQLNK